jgi:hypothetical protein
VVLTTEATLRFFVYLVFAKLILYKQLYSWIACSINHVLSLKVPWLFHIPRQLRTPSRTRQQETFQLRYLSYLILVRLLVTLGMALVLTGRGMETLVVLQ